MNAAVAREMPDALQDVVVAVLLLDLRAYEVVYANEHAHALTPDVSLPCSLDEWSEAACLHSEEGEPLGSSSGPLARIAEEGGYHGEAVRIDSEGGEQHLYMAAFPTRGADRLRDRALVVLLDFAVQDGPQDGLEALKNRAMGASHISFTISDPSLPDNPLIWVNDSFTQVTGYDFRDSVGRNCRFLQGPDTDPATVREIRQAIDREEATTVTLLNYRRDGSTYWNELTVSPVRDAAGRATHFVGVQRDVTNRVELERERERAYRAERQARAEAEEARAHAQRLQAEAEQARNESERAGARLLLLLQSTTALSRELDPEAGLAELADLLVPDLADWCAVDLVVDGHQIRRIVATSRVGCVTEPLRQVAETPPLVRRVLGERTARLLGHVDEQQLTHDPSAPTSPGGDEHVTHCSAMVVPLAVRREVLGVLTLVRLAPRDEFTDEDLRFAQDLARRVSFTVDNARLYERQRRVAEQLQRSLLPDLPNVPRLDLAARYLVSSAESEVGGDWYDVVPLPDGSTGIAVGDVMGHDLSAAATMGQLRSMLRSYAFREDHPGTVLASVDELMAGLGMEQLATAFYGRLENDGDGFVLRYASAGHLPMLVMDPDGVVELSTQAQSVLLGTAYDGDRPEATLRLSPGTTLVLFTDGLIERRGADIDRGLGLLQRAVAELGPDEKLDELCDGIVARIAHGNLADDAALLAVRVSERASEAGRGRAAPGRVPSPRAG